MHIRTWNAPSAGIVPSSWLSARHPAIAQSKPHVRILVALPLSILLGVTLLVPRAPTAAERDPPAQRCRAVVDQQITQVGLPQSRIERIQISRRRQDIRDSQRTVGFDGWVRLNDCRGSLVVGMDRGCNVQQVYVQGMCEVPGVETFD